MMFSKKIQWMGLGSVFFLITGSALYAEETPSSKSYKITQQSIQPTFSVPPSVAKVNGEEISIQDFWKQMLRASGNAVLLSMVDNVLIEQLAEGKMALPSLKNKNKKVDFRRKIQSELKERFDTFKKQFADEKTFMDQLKNSGLEPEDIKRQIRIDLYKNELLKNKIEVTQKEIQKYFDENKDRLATPELVHLKHILLASAPEAEDVLLALRVGANFELMAKAKSLDMATRDQGGDLGFFGPGMLIPALEERVFSLQVGNMAVVETALGFHVVNVLEKKPAQKAVLDKKTRKSIEQLIKQEKFNREYPPFIQNLRQQANIEVFLQ